MLKYRLQRIKKLILKILRYIRFKHMFSDSTCVLKAKPGKLDIKRHEPGFL